MGKLGLAGWAVAMQRRWQHVSWAAMGLATGLVEQWGKGMGMSWSGPGILGLAHRSGLGGEVWCGCVIRWPRLARRV
jgi:hypothetical protein